MYLKALEIQGFKSFPEKTLLTFEKDVTAIVGPNGSGKSNISDAVLWVMGEQRSKTLRGGKMEDVIFGGTEKRGAMGFAQVSLILDNSGRVFDTDNTEVMITRRYYRSGESEYYLNRQSVRLRDINELLMDTGLGRDGYSIIGQGRIDEILSAKSADRREVFEEAAGISRFRHRREEATRKLEKTDENLLRINDKIDELELQIAPLREQAETARRYLVLRDELRGLEVSVWMDNLDRLGEQYSQIERDFADSKASLASAQDGLRALYEKTEALSEKMREKDIEAESARERLRETETAIAECDSRIAVLKAKLGGNMEAIDRVRSEMAEQERLSSTLGAQIAERRARIGELRAAHGEHLSRYDKASEEARALSQSAGEAAERLSGLLRDEARENDAAARLQTMLSALADAGQALFDRDGEISLELGRVSERQRELLGALDATKSGLARAEETETELKNVIAGRKMKLESREKRVSELGERSTRLVIDLKSTDSRIAMLREMEKEYEGYSKAVKAVMRAAARGSVKNVHGPVANLIKTEARYALAIETALSGAMQSIVVDTQEDAKACIEMLKRGESGRATFLPIDVIRPAPLKNPPAGEKGYLGQAPELTRCEARYADIISSLLGRTAVTETLSDAVRIAKKHDNRFRLVSLDGQIVNAGGSMTGGSSAKNTGMLSRANELERLSEKREKIAAELESTDVALREARRELDAVKYELDVAGGELRSAQDDVLRSRAALSHQTELIENASASIEALREEKRALAMRCEQNVKSVEKARAELESHEKSAAQLRSGISEITGRSEALEAERLGYAERLSELRAAGASIEAEISAIESAVGELEDIRGGVSRAGGERRKAIEGFNAKNADIELELSERHGRLLQLKESAGEIGRSLAALADQKLELEGERSRAEKAGQEKNRELLDMERLNSRLEQRKLAADLEEKQIIDRLWDTYELSRTAACAIRLPPERLAGAGRRIAEIKREMSALGAPNLGAIEEYERVGARYSFLTEQRDDVEKAKNELLRIISGVTKEMKEIFTREFKLIDESFQKTFTELFGGGRASLALEDESDILECGIEIRVQPPGKAVSTITLLSGGERAFVAIALYFAILKVHPTPFCVMDEIEAALDEANVTRFARYLRSTAKNTQFIIITHRRGTMEEADRLYGVTMQEKGVSTIIGVDLDGAAKALAS